MPLTFPSHAAAVLPFCRGRRVLPPSALVVGSCAPDFAYLFDTGRINFHVWPTVVWPCLPIALAMWVLFEGLILPSLARTLGPFGGVDWGVLAVTRGLPKSWRGWLAASIGLAVGTFTHITWDGFTHFNRFPARELYAGVVLEWSGVRVALPVALQWLSTAVGIALVWREVKRVAPATGEVAPLRTEAPRIVATIVVAVLLSWAVLVLRWGTEVMTAAFGKAWLIFWYGARGGLLGLALASIDERLRRRRERAGRKQSMSSTG